MFMEPLVDETRQDDFPVIVPCGQVKVFNYRKVSCDFLLVLSSASKDSVTALYNRDPDLNVVKVFY